MVCVVQLDPNIYCGHLQFDSPLRTLPASNGQTTKLRWDSFEFRSCSWAVAEVICEANDKLQVVKPSSISVGRQKSQTSGFLAT